jgi:hypothetical protein
MFFECRYVCIIWLIIHVASNLYLPHIVSNMLGSCLWGFNKDLKTLVLLAAATICWAIWHCQNDIDFSGKILLLLVDYSLGYPLAPLLTCASKAYISGFGLNAI